MEKSNPTSNSQERWQMNSNESLDGLMELLKGLMATVRVANPVAKEDPGTAVKEMAKVIAKFPPGSIHRVIADLKMDPEAYWPSAGEMVVLCQESAKRDTKSLSGTVSTHARPSKGFENINGWRYDQIIKKTRDGQMALKEGRPHKFFMEIRDGLRDLPPEMARKPDDKTLASRLDV